MIPFNSKADVPRWLTSSDYTEVHDHKGRFKGAYLRNLRLVPLVRMLKHRSRDDRGSWWKRWFGESDR